MTRLMRRGAMGLLLLSVVLLLVGSVAFGQPLKSGDRMVFYGDSITEQLTYTRYVMNYYALRYPDLKVSFRNAGWSGDSAPGGLKRLQRDVLGLKPNLVSLCFGMNDGGYGPFDQGRYDRYMEGMTGLVRELKQAGATVVLLTPGAVDEDIENKGYNATLARFGEGVKELAAKEGLAVYDIHALMLDVETRAKLDNPKFTMIPDSVHPSEPGQAVMAYGLLEAMQAAVPASGLTLDAATQAVQADRCRVSDLRFGANEVTFTRTDEALPTYFDPEAASIFPYVPIVADLNQYPFAVMGLAAGTWKLSADGIDVGTFRADELAKGVNLATKPGPWEKLGAQVNELSREQEGLYRTRWKALSVQVWIPEEAAAEKQALLAKLDKLIAEREKSRAEVVSRRTWTWKLTRVP